MDSESESPFDRPDVLATYEAWYATPFGRLADHLEQRLLRELLAPLAPCASLLEIGCGTAHFSLALAGSGYRVAGADPSSRMLSMARTRVPVVQAAAERLPFRDRSFDGAFLVAVLDFVDDPLATLREARRVARERVAVIALASGSWLGLRRRLAACRGHPVFSRTRFRSKRELIGLARSAGAEPIAVRGALVLPPLLAGRLPRLEDRWARGCPPWAGLVAFSLPGKRA